MSATTAGPARTEAEEARERLLALLSPGDTVYTVLRHVSRSGMSRHIDLYVIRDNEPVFLSGYAAKLMGWRQKDGALVVPGVGMDAGFHVVYTLSRKLFAGGTYADPDAGYALNQRWL